MSPLHTYVLNLGLRALSGLKNIVGASCPSIQENKNFQFNLHFDPMFNFSTLSPKIQMFAVV